MSRSLGVLTLDLIAKTGNFDQGMDRAGRRVRQTANEMEAAKRAADRLVAGIAAAAAGFATAATAMAVSSAKSMDATAKMAQQIGTTTESLTGMRFAAQQFANISDQQFDMGMRRMTRRIAEAAEGGGSAKSALEAMGLSARELARLAPEQQMLAIADAMQRTEKQADRLRYTMALFDTEGMSLVPALQQGAEAFEANIALARQFGVVVSQEAAAAAEQFMTNMNLLNEAQKGFKNQIAEAVLPTLVSLTDQLVYFAETAGPVSEKVEAAMKAVGVAATATAAIFTGRLVGSLGASALAFTAATAEAVRYQMALARMAGVSSAAAAGVGALTTASRAGSVLLNVLGGPVGLIAALGVTAAGFIAFNREGRVSKDVIDSLTGAAEEAAKAFEKMGRLSREAALRSLSALHSEQAREASKAWHDFINDLEPTTLRGARAVAQMRSEMRSEVQAIVSDASLSSSQIEAAIDGLIAKWVEERRVTEDQAQSYRALAATAAGLQTAANETGHRLGELSEKARELDAATRGAAGGVRDLNEAMTNEAGQKYLERLADQSITAGLKTQREQLDALVAAGKLIYTDEDLVKARKHAEHIDKMNASLRAGNQATKDYASAMKSLVDTHLPHVKALEDLHKNLGLLDKAQKAGIVTGQNYVKALESINKAYARQVTDLLPESVKKAKEAVKAAQEQTKALQQQLRTFGLAESAVLALAAADTESAIAKLQAERATLSQNEATTERIQHIDAEIAKLRELQQLQTGMAGLQSQLEWKEREKAAWEDWSRDVEQIFNRVGQSLTDAIFDGGKSGKELLKDVFKGLTFNVLINPIMKAGQQWVTNQLGGLFGYQNPAQQAGSGGVGFGGGGGFEGLSKTLYSAGERVGSYGLQNFAAGLNNYLPTSVSSGFNASASLGTGSIANPSFSASMGGGGSSAGNAGQWLSKNGANVLTAASAIYDISQGNYFRAAGTVAGSFLPIPGGQIIGNVVGGFLDDMFGNDKPTTRRSQQGASHMLPDGTFEITHYDSRQDAATQEAARLFAEQAVKSANDLFAQAGVDAAIHGFQTLMESSVLGDKQGVGSSGQVRVGDQIIDIGIPVEPSWTQHGVGGWSEADMLPRLATDIQLTILEAFQAAGVMSHRLDGIDIRSLDAAGAEQLAATIQQVIQEVSALEIAAQQLPFANLRDLSFEARDGLLALTGGLESFLAAEQSYIQNYYTEAERTQLVWDEIGRVLGEVNVATPETRDGFRALKEAQDLTTESGRQTYAAIMSVQEAFASVTPSADDLAQASRQLADSVARAAQEALSQAISQGEAAYAALSRSIERQRERIRRESESIGEALRNSISAASTTVSELNSLTSRLTSTVQRMVQTGLDDARNREWAQERISRALSVATLTGVMPQGQDFEHALQIVAQPSQGLFDSFEDYQADFLRSAHDVSKLNELAGVQLTTEQRALESLQDQLAQNQEWFQAEMARLDGVLEYHRMQLDIAMGTYQAQLSEIEAIRAVETAVKNIRIAAANQQQYAPESSVSRGEQYLINNPDVMNAYLVGGSHIDGMAAEEFARWHFDRFGRWEGRSFDVGTNYVPHDMIAQVHKGEAIIPAYDNRMLMQAVMGGGTDPALRQEMAALRKSHEATQELLRELIRSSRDTSDGVSRIAAGAVTLPTKQQGPVATVMIEDRTT